MQHAGIAQNSIVVPESWATGAGVPRMDAVLIAMHVVRKIVCRCSSEFHCYPRKLGNRGRSAPHGCCPHSQCMW